MTTPAASTGRHSKSSIAGSGTTCSISTKKSKSRKASEPECVISLLSDSDMDIDKQDAPVPSDRAQPKPSRTQSRTGSSSSSTLTSTPAPAAAAAAPTKALPRAKRSRPPTAPAPAASTLTAPATGSAAQPSFLTSMLPSSSLSSLSSSSGPSGASRRRRPHEYVDLDTYYSYSYVTNKYHDSLIDCEGDLARVKLAKKDLLKNAKQYLDMLGIEFWMDKARKHPERQQHFRVIAQSDDIACAGDAQSEEGAVSAAALHLVLLMYKVTRERVSEALDRVAPLPPPPPPPEPAPSAAKAEAVIVKPELNANIKAEPNANATTRPSPPTSIFPPGQRRVASPESTSMPLVPKTEPFSRTPSVTDMAARNSERSATPTTSSERDRVKYEPPLSSLQLSQPNPESTHIPGHPSHSPPTLSNFNAHLRSRSTSASETTSRAPALASQMHPPTWTTSAHHPPPHVHQPPLPEGTFPNASASVVHPPPPPQPVDPRFAGRSNTAAAPPAITAADQSRASAEAAASGSREPSNGSTSATPQPGLHPYGSGMSMNAAGGPPPFGQGGYAVPGMNWQQQQQFGMGGYGIEHMGMGMSMRMGMGMGIGMGMTPPSQHQGMGMGMAMPMPMGPNGIPLGPQQHGPMPGGMGGMNGMGMNGPFGQPLNGTWPPPQQPPFASHPPGVQAFLPNAHLAESNWTDEFILHRYALSWDALRARDPMRFALFHENPKLLLTRMLFGPAATDTTQADRRAPVFKIPGGFRCLLFAGPALPDGKGVDGKRDVVFGDGGTREAAFRAAVLHALVMLDAAQPPSMQMGAGLGMAAAHEQIGPGAVAAVGVGQ